MKGLARFLVVGCIAFAGLVMVLSLAGGDAGAETVYLPENWQMMESTTLRNGTWQANGSVYLVNGTLTLEDAQLLLWSSYSYPEFMVSEGARLVARRSTISGFLGVYPYLYFASDVLLDNTTMSYYYSIVHYKGKLTVDNCNLEGQYYSIVSQESLVVRSSHLVGGGTGAIYWDYYSSASSPATLVVEDTVLVSEAGSSYGLYIEGSGSTNRYRQVVVRGCDIRGFGNAVYLTNFRYYGSVLIEGNTCAQCDYGLYVYYMSSVITSRHNVWEVRSSGIGIYVYSVYSTGVDPIIANETVRGGDTGIQVRETGSSVVELWNMTIDGPVRGVYCYYSSLEVHGGVINATKLDFYIYYGGYIYVYDCEHGYTGQVYGTSSPSARIAEIDSVFIEAVVWQSGLRIVHGTTTITNETGFPLGVRNNEKPRPLDIPTWLITYNGETRDTLVRGVFADRGVQFTGRSVEITNVTNITLTIIDDSPPWATVTEPSCGDSFPSATVKVKGLCDDYGAGLYRVTVRYGDGDWVDADLTKDGTWSTTLKDLPDDVADIRVRVHDLAGNRNDTMVEGIVVDTMYPMVTLVSPLRCVGSSPATMVAMTEPHSRAYVNGVEAPVADNGAIITTVDLIEGENEVTVRVVDAGGHENTVYLRLYLDSQPPILRIESPVDGQWSSSSAFTVTGIVSEDVTLLVNDIPREVEKGVFAIVVPLSEPFTLITLVAIDEAGNTAREARLVNIDRDIPSLRVQTPANGSSRAVENIVVSGTVYDNGPVKVTVSGTPAVVADGMWACELSLAEGSYTLWVKATDAAGNTASSMVTIDIDLTPPRAEVHLMVDGKRLDPSSVALHTQVRQATTAVTIDENCTVKVTGVGQVVLAAGKRDLSVPLVEGRNDVLVDVWDLAGNHLDTFRFQVVSDTTAPTLTLADAGPVRTRDPDLIVQGTTEPGCNVFVEGVEVTVLADGTFSTVVHLDGDLTRIEVVSVDPAGNRAETSVVAELEEVKVDGRSSDNLAAGLAVGLIAGLLVATLVSRWGRRPAGAGGAPPHEERDIQADLEEDLGEAPPPPREQEPRERLPPRGYDTPRTRVIRREGR